MNNFTNLIWRLLSPGCKGGTELVVPHHVVKPEGARGKGIEADRVELHVRVANRAVQLDGVVLSQPELQPVSIVRPTGNVGELIIRVVNTLTNHLTCTSYISYVCGQVEKDSFQIFSMNCHV